MQSFIIESFRDSSPPGWYVWDDGQIVNEKMDHYHVSQICLDGDMLIIYRYSVKGKREEKFLLSDPVFDLEDVIINTWQKILRDLQ